MTQLCTLSPCLKHHFHKCIARVLAYREALPMTLFYMELVLTTFAAVHPVFIFGYSCFLCMLYNNSVISKGISLDANCCRLIN